AITVAYERKFCISHSHTHRHTHTHTHTGRLYGWNAVRRGRVFLGRWRPLSAFHDNHDGWKSARNVNFFFKQRHGEGDTNRHTHTHTHTHRNTNTHTHRGKHSHT